MQTSTAALTDAAHSTRIQSKAEIPLLDVSRQAPENRSISPGLFAGFARLADGVLLMLFGLLIFASYVGANAPVWLYALPVAIIPLAQVAISGSLGAYDLNSARHWMRHTGRAFALWIAIFGSFTLLIFFLKISAEYSRVWLASWFLSGLVIVAANRTLAAVLARSWIREGRVRRRAAIVGAGADGAQLIRALSGAPESDVEICGVFDDRGGERAPESIEGYRRLGNIDDLIWYCRNAQLDMLIMTLPLSADKRVAELLERLWVLPVDIRIPASASEIRLRPRSYSHIGAIPFLDVCDRPIADWDSVVKRILDIGLATLSLGLFAPLMALTAIAIRLESPGPVFFRQKRYGFNNEIIDVLKFRSMYHDMADPDTKTMVTKNDPRVTRVGRFIRKTSIDELPQLFNVLRGELSLVGPRPHALNAHMEQQLYEQLVDGYFARHRVKPGVTGWAQVNGWRGEVDRPEKILKRVECDLFYIENWSAIFDLYILALTPFRLFSSEDTC